MSISTAVALVVAAIALSAPAGAQVGPPLDGNPVSPGLGPTYGEEWCAPVGSENVPQAAPLALIPYGAIRCTLDRFETEAAAAGVPDRFSYSVIGDSVLGRDIFGVVVNALETPEQQRDYARWQQLRQLMLAGLWRDRDRKAASSPMIVHGTTLVGSRYLGIATNPFSRGDAEREWPLIGQAALWSNLTDN